jgi:hypothetical protein
MRVEIRVFHAVSENPGCCRKHKHGYRQTVTETLIDTSLQRGVQTEANEGNRLNGFRKPLKRLPPNDWRFVTSLKRGVNESRDIINRHHDIVRQMQVEPRPMSGRYP